jgi:hypothetical protein
MKPALRALIVCLLSDCTSISAPLPEATGELLTLDTTVGREPVC